MSRRGFWLRHAVWPAVLLALAAALVVALQVDLRVGDFFFDPVAGVFPARALDAAERLHRGGRWVVVLVGSGALLACVASFVFERTRPWRRGATYVALCFAVGPGLVALGKQVSDVDCPWDLARYGGSQPYVALLADRPDGLPRAQCFPSAHAAGAYAFFAFYFLLRRYRPRRAPAALGATLLLGLLYGATQWARGAHFPSHDLASAAICWYTSLALAAALLRRARAAAMTAPPPLGESYAH